MDMEAKCLMIEYFKVKIVKSDKKSWYAKMIGKVIEVYKPAPHLKGKYDHNFDEYFNYSKDKFVSIFDVEIVDQIIFSEKLVSIKNILEASKY